MTPGAHPGEGKGAGDAERRALWAPREDEALTAMRPVARAALTDRFLERVLGAARHESSIATLRHPLEGRMPEPAPGRHASARAHERRATEGPERAMR